MTSQTVLPAAAVNGVPAGFTAAVAPYPLPVSQPVEPARAGRWFAPLFRGDPAALWPALVVTFVVLVAIGFAMSYHGLYTLGRDLMGWPAGLCVLAPVGVDVFSIVGLIATFLAGGAHWRVRFYCWVVFISTVGLSIAGNAVSAYAHLNAVAPVAGVPATWGYRQVVVVAGTAVWPALSAAALHLLIVVRRHMEARPAKIQEVAEKANHDAQHKALIRAQAIELAASGMTVPAIVEQLGDIDASQRSVERWTENVRAAVATKPAPPAKATAKAATRRVNTREEAK